MVGLQPPRGVTWEEVVSIYGCNFLLIEGKYYCELITLSTPPVYKQKQIAPSIKISTDATLCQLAGVCIQFGGGCIHSVMFSIGSFFITPSLLLKLTHGNTLKIECAHFDETNRPMTLC